MRNNRDGVDSHRGKVTEQIENTVNQEINTESTENIDSNEEIKQPITENTENTEKLLPQSKVDEIVKTAKIDAYNKGKKQAVNDYQLASASINASTQQQPNIRSEQENLVQNGAQDPSIEARIRQATEEEINRRSMYYHAENTANQFIQKMNAGRQKYNDFDTVISELNIPEVSGIVNFLNGLDNTADVVYEMGKNPSKYANVLTLMNVAPNLAGSELQKLSNSIKSNEEAKKQQKETNEPLSQVNASITGTDSGEMTVSDLRKQPWLRK